jgi:uncharacterized OB-fold protein
VSEGLVADFEVEFPFIHSTGPALSRFFTALRDDGVIWGRRCDTCARVVVPAQDYCETCSDDLGDWVAVGPEGTLVGFTVVREAKPIVGLEPPFAFVRVRLDGAGTDFVHLAPHPDGLKHGARVRPVWADERSGTIRDIAGFEVIT